MNGPRIVTLPGKARHRSQRVSITSLKSSRSDELKVCCNLSSLDTMLHCLQAGTRKQAHNWSPSGLWRSDLMVRCRIQMRFTLR